MPVFPSGWRVAALGVVVASAAGVARAQFDGARLYWPLPQNSNAVALRSMMGTANATWSNWSTIEPSAAIDSDLWVLSYMRVQPVFGRTAYWQAMLPYGSVETSSPLPGAPTGDYSDGIADPTLAATVNVFGKPGMPAREFARFDQDLSVDLGLAVSIPVGTYDAGDPLNLGSNQWKVRFAAPIVQAIGPWVPGERTTIEVMPFASIFGDNDGHLGNRISQDPLFGVEAHLTRDLTRESFLSLDYTWLDGGDQRFTDLGTGLTVREPGGFETQTLGLTAGFRINDNLQLTISHMQTISGSSGGLDLDGSLTMITLSWGWHDVLQRVRDFRDQ